MLAFKRLGIEVKDYYAYEIDKYAIQVSQHNFPSIIQCGDVFDADYTQFDGIDYLIGGSPCTFWSIAQKNNRETEASGMGWELFSQFVRAIKEAKPKYFLYENNKSMSRAIYDSISDTFGFEPICINSALVSAQNRQRLYWVGIRQEDGTYQKADIEQPEDRGILLRDILENNADDLTSNEKGWTLTTAYGGAVAWNTIERHQRNMAVEPVALPKAFSMVGDLSNRRVGVKDKAYCLASNPTSDVVARTIEPVNTTGEGKSQTIKAQYQQTSIANICKYTSTYGASGVAEPVGMTKNDKSYCLTAGYKNGSGENIGNYVSHTIEKGCKSMVAEQVGCMPSSNGETNNSQAMRVYSQDGKSVTLSANGGGLGGKTGLYAVTINTQNPLHYAEPCEWQDDIPIKAKSFADGKVYTVYEVVNGQITIKGKTYPIKLSDGFYIIRKLTVRECMRLQTVPEWYDFSVISNSQAYKCLGNGWTVEVIAHLLKSIT